MALVFLIAGAPSAAAANCADPTATAGAMIYNADYATMQFCNGSSWISMAASGALTEVDPHVGTLAAGKFCTSNAGGTQVVCTTASIPVSALSTTGTASSTTYLRGDGAWVTAPGGAPSGAAGGDLTGTYPNPSVAAGAITIAKLAATGTADSTTYLRGDGAWAAPPAGSPAGTIGSVQYRNSSGAFAGNSNLTYVGDMLFITGGINITGSSGPAFIVTNTHGDGINVLSSGRVGNRF